MGFSFYVNNLCYILISRDNANTKCEIPLKADQSVTDWIKMKFPDLQVIPGVTEDTAIFDKDNEHLRQKLENGDLLNDQEEQKQEDNDWAAIILSNEIFESYKGKRERSCDSFNVQQFSQLFDNPEKDLFIVTETECFMSE